MVERATLWVEGLSRRWTAWRKTRAWKRVAALLAVVTVAACAVYLGPQLLAGLRGLDWATLRGAARPAGLSVLLTAACVLLGGLNWWLILRGLGYALPLDLCLRIHTGSNLAGYLPGYAWKYLGKAYLTGKHGVPARALAAALGYEFAGLLLSGLLVSLALLPPSLQAARWQPIWPALRGIAAALTVAGLAAAPLVLARFMARGHGSGPAGRFARPPVLWGALLLMVGSWLLYGTAHALLVSGLAPLPRGGWQVCVFSLAASYVVTLVALFVPGGLGIREAVIAQSLGTIIAPGAAALVAVSARLALIVAELVAFGLAFLWTALRGQAGGAAGHTEAVEEGHNRSITQMGE